MTAASMSMHRKLNSTEIAPLPASDDPFMFELEMLVPSVIGSVGLFLLGARMRLSWLVLAAGWTGLGLAAALPVALGIVRTVLSGAGDVRRLGGVEQ